MNTEAIIASGMKVNSPEKARRQYPLKKLCDYDIVDRKGAQIGKLIDMVISYPSGQVTFAVVASGGFLGLGKTMMIIPLKNMELDIRKQRFALSINKEQLKKAPSFTGSSWPNLHNEAWAQSVMKFYADNSAEK